jgi:hypothetical protein
MKEKDGFIDCPEQQVILYVEKEDGKYGPMQTGSYITRNFLEDYEEKRKHLEDSLLEKVRNKEVSSIYYYMVIEELTVPELASRVGVRKGKVRKHLEFNSFNSIKEEILQKYADVFNVKVMDLYHIMGMSNYKS